MEVKKGGLLLDTFRKQSRESFVRGWMEFVDTVAIGIRDDLKNFNLSNCKDGIATSRDRFESASFLQKAKANLCC